MTGFYNSISIPNSDDVNNGVDFVLNDAIGYGGYGLYLKPSFFNLITFADFVTSRRPLTNFNSAPFYVITAELTPNMFSALCSWTYNLGSGALQRSSLRRLYINEGRYQEAADEMLKWVFCNGRRLRGLVLRRTDERALFLA